jgi:hypothetical protein
VVLKNQLEASMAEPSRSGGKHSGRIALDSPASSEGAGSFRPVASLGSEQAHRVPTQWIPASKKGQTADGAPSNPATDFKVKGVVAAGAPLSDAEKTAITEAVKSQSNKRYIAYADIIKVGGTIAWRANNPGNLRDAPTKIDRAQGAEGYFAVFATMDDGEEAQKSLYLNKFGKMSVKDAITGATDAKTGKVTRPGLTPPSENDTEAYLKKLKAAGVDIDKTVEDQIDKLMPAVKSNEGMKAGVEIKRAP